MSGTVYAPLMGRTQVSRALNPHLEFVSWQANLDVLTGEVGWDQILIDEIANMGDGHVSKLSGKNFNIETNVLENMRSKVMRMISGIKLRSLTWSTDSYHRGAQAKTDDWDTMGNLAYFCHATKHSEASFFFSAISLHFLPCGNA